MVVTNDGKNRIRDLLSADITTGQLGTVSTDPTVGDTALGGAVAVTSATNTQTTGNKLVNSKHVLLSTIGTLTTYNEFAVYMNSGSVMLNRVVFPDYAHTSNLELHSTTVFRIL
jgi:hypothetical protein